MLCYGLMEYIVITWKNSKTTTTKKLHLAFRRIFHLILGCFWPFYVVFVALRRFWPFDDGNQDADIFPAMIAILQRILEHHRENSIEIFEKVKIFICK